MKILINKKAQTKSPILLIFAVPFWLIITVIGSIIAQAMVSSSPPSTGRTLLSTGITVMISITALNILRMIFKEN